MVCIWFDILYGSYIPGFLEGAQCGNYTAASGSIMSPNYPSTYPDDITCMYTVRQPEGITITLKWHYFDLFTSYWSCVKVN